MRLDLFNLPARMTQPINTVQLAPFFILVVGGYWEPLWIGRLEQLIYPRLALFVNTFKYILWII
jgi:hypothetical protein